MGEVIRRDRLFKCWHCMQRFMATHATAGKIDTRMRKLTWKVHTAFIIFIIHLFGTFSICDAAVKVPLRRINNMLNEAIAEMPSLDKIKATRSVDQMRDLLQGQPGQGYYVEMSFGTPPQKLNILVDTGSSNFAVSAAPHPSITSFFNISMSSTFESSGVEVIVPYTQGNWVGVMGHDLITLPSMENISVNANLALIKHSEDFFINGSQWQGILGLAYAEIARPDPSVKPFFDSVVEQTDIPAVFSIQLCGSRHGDDPTTLNMDGTMVLGGVDSSLYKGQIYYTPTYKEWYYEVVLTDVAVNGQSVNLDCKEYNFDKTIVDSGTTNLRLPKKVFQEVLMLLMDNIHLAGQIVPALFWSGEDLLCWSLGTTPWAAFPSIELSLAAGADSSITLILSPLHYLRAVPDDNSENNSIIPLAECYKFAISPSETGAVLGATVMEAFYVIFDQEEKRVGFAVNTCQNDVSDALHAKITGPFDHVNTMDCAYVKPNTNQSALLIAAYIMSAICAVCLLPLVILFAYWQVNRCRQRSRDTAVESADDDSLLTEDVSDR